MSHPLKAPFPWFGGKSLAAPAIWAAIGADVPNYVEPFAGGLGALLGRPGGAGKVETINDKDAFICNFWRAVQYAPDEVARHADWPVNEADLHARHRWLIAQVPLIERLIKEPAWFDSKIAGWWCWGLCQWVGTGWTAKESRQIPFIGNMGMGVHSLTFDRALFSSLSERLRRARVVCGDWKRVVGRSALGHTLGCMSPCGVLLDPPYDGADDGFYRTDQKGIAQEVAEWAAANGADSRLRIVLCGADGDYQMPAGWRVVMGKSRGANSGKERLWLSPHCLVDGVEPADRKQRSLFGMEAG